MKKGLAILSLLFLSACGSTASLNEQGAQVQVVQNEPVHCEDLGTFYGSGTGPEYALNNLRNIVGETGGDHLYVTRGEELVRAPLSNTVMVLGNDHTIYGRGFKCH